MSDSRNSDIRIVLVNPSHPGNVGAAARAIKNMGLNQLVLVEPQEFPDPRALWRAAGAKDIVEAAVVTQTLDEAIADCQLVVGTSARERKIPWPLVDARSCGERVAAESAGGAAVALLFGREDSGLTNEELQRCNLHVNIQTSEHYRSLNLAMAVQILSYEIRMAQLADEARITDMADWDEPLASAEDMERFFEHLGETLEGLGFYNPQNPRQLMTRLRRLFTRSRVDQMEMNILRGILADIQKVVKKQ